MKHLWLGIATASILASSSILMFAAADPGIALIGTAFISGSASDLSGLTGSICALDIDKNVTSTCIPKATLGGFGSGLASTGHDNVYVFVPDRGPFDGRTDVPYLDRFHFVQMTVDTSVAFPPAATQSNIQMTLLDTRFFQGTGNQNFVGDAYAFSTTNPLATLRFDPEGVVVGRDGTFFVSDEYGPYIREFNRQGHLIRRILVPDKFLLTDPAPSGNQSGDLDNTTDAQSLELYNNTTGRQANRGMEGLAITPDGKMLVGIMQNALLQDHGVAITGPATTPGSATRKGLNNRILTIDLETGTTHEYVYSVDAINQGRGVNEILAINNHEFLVLERDNRSFLKAADSDPKLKQIYKIDLNKANLTDVSGIASLPQNVTGANSLATEGIIAVDKVPVINMLNAAYKVNTSQTIKDVIAEKMEGMAWGPDLLDGHHVLFVASDNDLNTGLPTQIYAFAIDGTAAGINYQPQELPGPLYPPGQFKTSSK
jgi:hypothetical protein